MMNVVGGIFQDTTNFVPEGFNHVFEGFGGTEKERFILKSFGTLIKGHF